VAAQLFDMLARMSTSVSIAGFACRICRRALRRIGSHLKDSSAQGSMSPM
jgi:hypothetical protein